METTAKKLAGSTKFGRNRAVDLYRALAMLAVAFGHWVVIVAYRRDGELISGNALEFVPDFQLATWIFQVMPLFFIVGGFASAASLDSKGIGRNANAAERSAWIASRLGRLLPPVAALGVVWLAAILFGYLTGMSALINAGAIAAAIPLWFLANYVADVILAPHVLPMFRRSPGTVVVGALSVFGLLELLRVSGALHGLGMLEHLPHINWILGWFIFQIAGFAWRDGLLPSATALVAWSAGLAATAGALVIAGPWPVSMVNFPGLAHSPTHPPTIALMLFGAAQGAIAIAAAPKVTAMLERRNAVWQAVIAANAMAMTVYLWHMTAGVAVLAVFDQLGLLSAAAPGSAGWWLAKVPFVLASLVVLGLIVPRLSKIERRALLAPRADWVGSPAVLIAGAVVVSFALKGWTTGNIALIVPSLLTVIGFASWLQQATRPLHSR